VGVLTEHVSAKFFLAKAEEKEALAALHEGVRERELSDDYVHDPRGVLAAKSFVAALRATASSWGATARATSPRSGGLPTSSPSTPSS
jgi:hypothetical protein